MSEKANYKVYVWTENGNLGGQEGRVVQLTRERESGVYVSLSYPNEGGYDPQACLDRQLGVEMAVVDCKDKDGQDLVWDALSAVLQTKMIEEK